jgi:hypothetical protein
MYEAGGNLQAMFELVKEAVDAVFVLLKPLTVAFTGLLTLTTDYGDKAKVAADKLRQQAEAQTAVKTSGDLAATSLNTLREKMMSLRGETENLRDIQIASYQMDAKMTGDRILQAERVQDEAEAKGALAGRLDEINKLTMDQVGIMAQYGVIANSQAARDEAAAERFKLNSAAVLAEEIKKREGISASRQAEYDQANKLYLEFERMRLTNEGAPKPVTTPTGGGGGGGDKDKPETEAERGARLIAEAQAAVDAALAEMDAIKALREKNDKDEQQLELDKMKRTIEINDAKYQAQMDSAQRAKDFEQKLEDEYTAAKHAAGELTEEEEKERDAARLQAVKDRVGQELGFYMQSAGKQLAIGKLSAKAAADMARSALGNIIIGLGDKAMAESAIMAAALNPMSVPMAAAGLAAYAVGNAMMPTVKQAGTTPATEKAEAAAPAATNNYAFNMRVDSVFADGESVARQFAMMQESARQRGLLMQGA